MNYESLVNLMETLRSHAVLTGPIRKSGERYASISCVFAPWRHEKGKDATPSMTISFGEGEASRAHCFSCGYDGCLADMVAEVHALYPGRIGHLIVPVVEAEYMSLPPFPTMASSKSKDSIRIYDSDLASVGKPLPPEAFDFLASKGCPASYAEKMRLRWIDTMMAEKADGDFYELRRAILFPVFATINGKVVCVGAQAREINQSPTMPKYVMAFRFHSSKFFYGDHLLGKISGREVFLLEGPLDAIHLLSVGSWALGLFGIALQKEKVEKLKQAAPAMVYVLLDPDKAGSENSGRVLNALSYAGIPSKKLVTPKDPRTLTSEELLCLTRSVT